MILDGYYLDVLPDGSIILDPEIKPGLLQVLAGDEFVVKIRDNNRIVLAKKGRNANDN